MPSLGADMTAGTLRQWYVKPGDHVKRGDTIALVETDKANVDIEVFQTGVVERLLVEPDRKVPVGTALAFIRGEGEAPTAAAVAAPERPAARVLASPAARRLARELEVDLVSIVGSGPHGAIERADVERAAASAKAAVPSPPAPPAEVTPPPAAAPMSGMRRAIAAAMARSNREIPHYYLETRVDMQAALHRLEQMNAQRPIKDRCLPAALLLKAVALALAEVPELNGYWIDDGLQVNEGIHLGVAISLRQGGLVIPAMHDVDMKSIDEVMEALRDLITRARAGRLKSSEMTDGTITVTNLGDLGVETVYGVIYPPQVALVGFGKILDQVWVEDGMTGIRPVVSVTLAGDHRATDGHRGAQFLSALAKRLQEPDTL